MKVLSFLVMLAPIAAHAQVQPQPSATNPHVQTVDFVADQMVELQAAPGYQLMVELGPDEHIENIAVGDSGAWQVTMNRQGNRFFIKLLQPDVTTNMTVISDARLYSFDLVPLSEPKPNMAYTVRFKYPASTNRGMPPDRADNPAGRYILRGYSTLKPVGMHDDGIHTYIEWPPEVALPAIYAIDDGGKEMLVNGMMRDGRMVVDSVHEKFVFRIDDRKATAIRQALEQKQ